MSGFKDTLKGGWHPKSKDGKSKESWRGDFKGINQVAGWMGKGKDTSREDALEHRSTPISALKDPSSFGPPPKSVKYHGSAALPPPSNLSSQSKSDIGGLGAPIPQSEIRAQEEAEEAERRRQEEEASKPKSPPMPYRANTTGLSVAHLPPPPGRKDGADGRIPHPTSIADKPNPPGLPPRLPPRQNSSPAPSAPSPPPTYGAATSGDPHREHPHPTKRTPIRFSKLTTSPTPSPNAPPPTSGTTLAQKQAALKTASAFHKDPTSISLAEARTAASTANNFRERHGEQVKSGWASANKLNAKYGIADKVGSYGGLQGRNDAAEEQGGSAGGMEEEERDLMRRR
ncbi:hypothetical protein DID88_005147 [Monilinia fructigena]|uniref:Uncharacterized protein n=1 Tax=Monilinia fructigena TaxID=38457 RepID=A0A395IDK6_9HELO|nr:hypothetical protein DID88_005147 [Monilinia fructigena]